MYWSLICLFLLLGGQEHPVHRAVVFAEYNAERKALEITVKTFSDDLQAAIQKASGESRLEIGTEREPENAAEFIEVYLKHRLQFKLDGKAVSYKYLRHFQDKENILSTIVLLEVPNVEPFQRMYVENILLTELFDDQLNILNAKNKNKRQFKQFHAKSPTAVLSW